MKKFMLILMAAAAVALVSCKKDNKRDVVKEDPNTVIWGGVTYKTVTLKDGRTWMAEPLRYIPQGKKASENPADDSGLWYPYKSDGTTCTPLKDEASIKKLGYLYDYETALGAKISEDNLKSFEGKQGICPDGWHIPTSDEFVALCGYRVGIKEAGLKEIINDKAAYYIAEYKGAKIADLDKDGFNWTFSGSISRNTSVQKGSYMKLITDESVCSVPAYLGKNRMSYLMSSTGAKVGKDKSGNITNYQFFGLMSTFTKVIKDGKLSVALDNYKAGYSIRCIKNLK